MSEYKWWISGVGFFMGVITLFIIAPRWQTLNEWQRWVGIGWMIASGIVVLTDLFLAYRVWRRSQGR